MPVASGGMGRGAKPNPPARYSKNSNKAKTVSAFNPSKGKKKKKKKKK